MEALIYPESFEPPRSSVRNVNEILEGEVSLGQRAADWTANAVGSWRFVIAQTLALILWVVLNAVAWTRHWDPYPFILMNLFLSLQAAYAAPIIMMSQNQQAARDRVEAHNDYLINQKAEQELRVIVDYLETYDQEMIHIHQLLLELRAQSHHRPNREVEQ